MEEKQPNRTVWLIVVAALVAVCICCLLAAAAVAGGLLFAMPMERSEMDSGDGQGSWQRYEVGEAPVLTIDNFSGSVSVRAGEAGAIEVVANKQARRKDDLDQIKVDITRTPDGLAIKAEKPPGVGNASVQFEITAPADTRLDGRTGSGSIRVEGLRGAVKAWSGSGSLVVAGALGGVDAHTGSGSIEVRGVGGGTSIDSGSGSLQIYGADGELEAQTGSGSIEVREASGPVRMDSCSGGIDYEGSPQGDCRFETGSGSITLHLPAGLDMAVDFHTGSGRIEVAHETAGHVTASKGQLTGVIGSGEEGSIWAHTGSGNIHILQR